MTDSNDDITNHEGWSKELEALCNRLEAAEFRIRGTRLDLYRKTFATINQFIGEHHEYESQDTLKEELRKKIPDETLVNDLHESHELSEACKDFPDLDFPGLKNRLEEVLKGPRELESELPDKGRPRNLLFELVIAGLLNRAGLPIRLDGEEDVFFKFRNTTFFVECKRIHSTAKIQKNIEKAAEQIGRRCDDAGTPKTRGIIAIDVSKLINPGGQCPVYPDLETLKSGLEQVYLTFNAMFRPQPPKEARVLGVYVYLRLPGQVLNPPGTLTVWKSGFSVNPAAKIKDGNNKWLMAFIIAAENCGDSIDCHDFPCLRLPSAKCNLFALMQLVFGIGVQPDGTLVNLFTGQDESAAQAAIVAAGQAGSINIGYVFDNPPASLTLRYGPAPGE